MNEKCFVCQERLRLEGSYWRCTNCGTSFRAHDLDTAKMLLHKILHQAGTHMVDITGPCLAFDYSIIKLTQDEDAFLQTLIDP